MPIVAALPAIAGVAGSVASGVIQSNAASKAAKAAQQAAAQGNQLLATSQAQSNANLQPFVNYGQSAANSLSGLLGIGGDPAASQAAFDKYLGSTNYGFQLGQGEQAINTAAAPAFNSGATAKALNNYAQGQAGSALAGYENILGTGVNSGITAGSNLGNLANTNAGAQSANLNAAAGVTGNAAITGASALTNALRGVTSGLSSFGSGGSGGVGSALSGLFGGGSSNINTSGLTSMIQPDGFSGLPFASLAG